MIDLTSTFAAANKAYASGDFDKAKLLLDDIIQTFPSTGQALASRYLRARGYEDGLFGAPDLELAAEDFDVLANNAHSYGSDGLVGYARVLFEKDKYAFSEKAISLCVEAVAIDSNVKAMMMLGLIYEEAKADYKSAGKWYLRAYRRGLPWGMRYYARLRWKQGKYLRAIAGHVASTITSPILVAIYGLRSPFK